MGLYKCYTFTFTCIRFFYGEHTAELMLQFVYRAHTRKYFSEIMYFYSLNNMIAKQIKKKKKNSKYAATTLLNEVYRTIMSHL